MGHRQLALIFAIVTALLILAFTAVRLSITIAPVVSVSIMVAVYIASSLLLIFIAKKKWELDYKNALIMLVSSSVVSALIIAGCYNLVHDAIVGPDSEFGAPSFGSLFIINFFIRIPIDAFAAIFRKRKS